VLALHDANIKNPVLHEAVDGLVDQGQKRDGEDNSLALVPGHVDDLCRDYGFTRAGGSLNHRVALTGGQ